VDEEREFQMEIEQVMNEKNNVINAEETIIRDNVRTI